MLYGQIAVTYGQLIRYVSIQYIREQEALIYNWPD